VLSCTGSDGGCPKLENGDDGNAEIDKLNKEIKYLEKLLAKKSEGRNERDRGIFKRKYGCW
jgi:aminopeptidase-like protein